MARPVHLGLLVLGCALGAVALVALALEWAEPRPAVRSAVVREKSFAESGLLARGFVATNHLARGERLRFWVMLRASEPLTDVEIVEVSMPGFAVPAGDPCWSAGPPRVPVCAPARSGGAQPRPRGLGEGQALVVMGDVIATAWAGQFAPTVSFTWRAKGSAERGVLALGPVQVESFATYVPRFFRRVFSVLKDLALPLVLVGLGFLVQTVLSQQSERREAQRRREAEERLGLAEREAEARRKLAEEEAARRREEADVEAERAAVMQLMLPIVHRNSERHYMPICSAVRSLAAYRGPAPAGDEDRRFSRCYFALLLAFHGFGLMHREISGFFFRSRMGETVLSELWAVFFRHADAYLPLERRQRLLDGLPPRPQLQAFLSHTRREELASVDAVLREGFARWEADDFWTKDFPLLEALRAGILFEANRPQELWYGEPERFDEQRYGHAVAAAVRRLRELGEPILAERVERYFDGLKREPAGVNR